MTTWTVKKSDALLPGAWGVRSRVKGLDRRMFGVVMVGTGFILGPGCNKCQLQDLVPPVECHMRPTVSILHACAEELGMSDQTPQGSGLFLQ